MATIRATASFQDPGPLAIAIRRIAAELYQLSCALFAPGKIIAEVQQMQALWAEADRVQAHNPARARELRRQASRAGLN